MQEALSFGHVLLINLVLQKFILFVFLHCRLQVWFKSTYVCQHFFLPKRNSSSVARKMPSITRYYPTNALSTPESSFNNSVNNAPAIQYVPVHQTTSSGCSITSWPCLQHFKCLTWQILLSSLGLPFIRSQKLPTCTGNSQ